MDTATTIAVSIFLYLSMRPQGSELGGKISEIDSGLRFVELAATKTNV